MDYKQTSIENNQVYFGNDAMMGHLKKEASKFCKWLYRMKCESGYHDGPVVCEGSPHIKDDKGKMFYLKGLWSIRKCVVCKRHFTTMTDLIEV